MNDGDRLLENPSMSKDAMLFNSYEDLKDAKLRLDDSDQQSSKQEVSGDNKTGKQFANPLSKSQGDGLCVSILTKNTSINANAVSDEKFLHHNNKNGTKSSCVSSCKRKPASPKKRLLAQESIAISAETGEIVDDCLSKEATCSDPVKTETLEMKKIVDGFRRKKYMKNNKSSAFSFVNNSLSVPDLQTLASILTNQPNQLTSFTKSKKDKNTITKDNDQIQSNKHSADLLNSLAAADIASTLFGSPHNVTALDAAINGLLLAGQGGCATTTTTTTNQLAPSDMIPLMNGLLPFVTTSLPANTLEGITSNSQTNLAFLEATAAAAVANDALQTLLSGSSDSGSLAPPSTSSILDISLNSKGKSLNVALNASKQEEEIEMNQTSCISNGRVSSTKPSFPQLSNDKVSMKRKILALDDETIRNASRAITREERIDLEELESFAQKFKRQRIKFGFTQGDVGMALGRRYGTDFSQTTISRFEALNLSFKNMCKLRPLLKEWLADAEAAIANGASVSDLLEINPNDSQSQCLDNSLGSLAASSGICEPPSPNGSGISGSGIPLRKRRKRTNLDLSQRSALDAYFNLNPRPDHDKMAEIAELLELDRDVVRVWFCNRRQKLRRE